MNHQKILKSLKTDQFIKIVNTGNWFESGSVIYAKEIKQNIFLLFVIFKDAQEEKIRALIAHFDSFSSIGAKEPKQIMFYLSIREKEDLHYFEKYLNVTENKV